MAIFGTGQPRFITAASEEVDLDNIIRTIDEPVTKYITNENPISLEREFVWRGQHWKWGCEINLFKYTDPTDKFNQIFAQLGTIVNALYPHRDNDPIKTTGGMPCPFLFAECSRFYIEQATFRDGLRLLFLSKSPVDIAQCTSSLLATEKREIITTEKGVEIELD